MVCNGKGLGRMGISLDSRLGLQSRKVLQSDLALFCSYWEERPRAQGSSSPRTAPRTSFTDLPQRSSFVTLRVPSSELPECISAWLDNLALGLEFCNSNRRQACFPVRTASSEMRTGPPSWCILMDAEGRGEGKSLFRTQHVTRTSGWIWKGQQRCDTSPGQESPDGPMMNSG